jgi:hypothetical protein
VGRDILLLTESAYDVIATDRERFTSIADRGFAANDAAIGRSHPRCQFRQGALKWFAEEVQEYDKKLLPRNGKSSHSRKCLS